MTSGSLLNMKYKFKKPSIFDWLISIQVKFDFRLIATVYIDLTEISLVVEISMCRDHILPSDVIVLVIPHRHLGFDAVQPEAKVR